MDATPLYDWSPVFQLMLIGLLVALGPLSWVWLRSRNASPQRRLQVLTLLTLFLTFDLVLFGAFTRLTDSGLGCPDWPGCYGHASPVGAHQNISAAQTALPTGPVTHGKAWVEMVHRYLATGVGVLILVMTLFSWLDRKRLAVSPWWATATLIWVCLQGVFGALTVTMKLFPLIVTLHLLGGLGLLALLRAQSVLHRPMGAHWGEPANSGLRSGVGWVLLLVWAQVALGGWVSTNYAVLACSDFPTCQGAWWPDMDFRHGFALWRALGEGQGGGALPFAALTAIHLVHRLGALVVVAALLLLSWRLYQHQLTQPAKVLWALVAWQLISGLSNVVLDWPMVAAVAHTGGAAALVAALTGYWVSLAPQRLARLPDTFASNNGIHA